MQAMPPLRGGLKRMAVPALAVLALPAALSAQRPYPADLKRSSYVGVGYVASIPNAYLGFSALGLTPRIWGGAGLYADVKVTPGSIANDPYYRSDISVDQAELTYADMLYEEKSDWLSINGAGVYALTRDFAVFGGAGYSRERHYRQYFDASKTRGQAGFYWISDPGASGGRLNLLAGGIFRLGRYVLVEMGGATQPRGAIVGFSFVLPR